MMGVFEHHVYEYKRGLRDLILHTAASSRQEAIERKLQHEQIPYIIFKVNSKKINVFFGHPNCIELLQSFDTLALDKLSNEQDFILGILLGYDRLKQCMRYLMLKQNNKQVEELIG